MKFINYLTSITGIGIFPLISLVVFFVFFVLLGIYVMKADKVRFNYLAELPVDKNENDQDKITGTQN
jgi:cytochrome c oxidase cbb3-type subunit 3